MSVHFVSGKPGGGKSLFGTSRIVTELQTTQRRICANIPLDMGRLREYLLKIGGRDCGVMGRVKVMTPAETAQFWLHYGPNDGPMSHTFEFETGRKGENDAKLKHLTFRERFRAAAVEANTRALMMKEAVIINRPMIPMEDLFQDRLCEAVRDWLRPNWSGGVLYVIDEAHEFFNARKFSTLGADALHYLSQHRHLGDDVMFITQHVLNVDSQLRRVAQDFSYIRNLKKVKMPGTFGLVKAPAIFVRSTYLEEHTPGSFQEPIEVRTFTLDREGLASCYRTADGVGIEGAGAADTNEKSKGAPWWTIPAVVAAVIVAGIVALSGVKAYAVSKVEDRKAKHEYKVVKNTNENGPPTNSLPLRSEATHEATKESPPEMRLAGIASSGPGTYWLMFDNGETWFSDQLKDFRLIRSTSGRAVGFWAGGKSYSLRGLTTPLGGGP